LCPFISFTEVYWPGLFVELLFSRNRLLSWHSLCGSSVYGFAYAGGSLLQRDPLCDYPTGKSPSLPDCGVSSPSCKNISVFPNRKSSYMTSHPVPTRGALRNVINAGWDAVDAGGTKDEGAIPRTAKACGPDLPMLGSSLR
jgi:hypothetical protein